MIILSDDKGSKIGLLFEKKDAEAMVQIIAAALAGKKLNPQSNAHKLATKIDDELPIY